MTKTERPHRSNCLIILLLSAFILLASTQSSHAVATLKLDDGSGAPLLIADGSALDTNAAPGVVGYNGAYGAFSINVITGFVFPVLAAGDPIMHLNSVNVSSSSSSTVMLDIFFSEINFGPYPFPGFFTEASTTTNGTTEFFSYIDNSNALFGQGTQTGHLGPFSNGSFAGTASSVVSPSNPFSLTTHARITHTGDNTISSFDLEVNVLPEPVSSALFVVGGATFGLRRFWRKRKIS